MLLKIKKKIESGKWYNKFIKILNVKITSITTIVVIQFKVLNDIYCVISVCIQGFSGLYFPASRLNTEKYSVYLRIQCECMKIQTRKTPNTDNFHAVIILPIIPIATIVAIQFRAFNGINNETFLSQEIH